MSSDDPGPIVLCAGQYSSASTWLYNAAHALLADAHGEAALHRQFADSADDLPARPDGRALILKAHAPTAGLRWLLARGGGRAIVTLRDPRDAAASLIHRFGFDYPLVSSRVERSGAALPLLAESGLPMLLLRYEDGFADRRGTLRRIANFLGLAPSGARLAAIFAQLTPDAVRAEIARLHEAGALGPDPTPHSHDGATHWHPGHVGDGKVGKFATLLTPGQVGDIARRTRSYQQVFGYRLPPLAPLAPGGLALEGWGPGLAYLGEGFAAPDAQGAWTEGPAARLHLPGVAGGWLDLDLELPRRPGRPAPNPMRWSIWAEGGAVPLHGPVAAAATPERQLVTVPLPGPGDLLLRCEDLAPARVTRLEGSGRLLGLRLRGFAVRPA